MNKRTKVQTKEVKLLGGPMNGRKVTVARSAEKFDVGPKGNPFWTYTFAGKVDRQEVFALRPKSRRARRFVMWYIGQHGKDPRMHAYA